MRLPFLKNEIAKFRTETAGAETLCVLPNALTVELVLLKFKRFDGLDDRVRRLFVEKQAVLAVDHRFKGAPLAERYDGSSAGLRLQGRDAKVFFSCENEG